MRCSRCVCASVSVQYSPPSALFAQLPSGDAAKSLGMSQSSPAFAACGNERLRPGSKRTACAPWASGDEEILWRVERQGFKRPAHRPSRAGHTFKL